jgi:hypothetical protein
MSDRFAWLGELTPYLPPAFGALVGLRYTRDQSPVQKASSFFIGFGLAIYIAPAIAEVLSLGPKATVAVGILTAIIGMDAIGGLMAAVAQFKEDPIGTGRRWINAWLGRSDP